MVLALDLGQQPNNVENNIELRAWQHCSARWQTPLAQITRHKPDAVVFPQSRAALAEIVQRAQRENLTIIPCGNGSKLSWGGLTPKVDWLVSTQKLNNIVDHAVDDLTITVEAGLSFAKLQNYLASQQQYLPLDPAFYNQATLGGIVATADTGSLRQRYGGVRDLLLGMTIMRSDGTLAKAGGKVVKNVAGYDLMKLLSGSYGTLGTIVELTFRLYPIQEKGISLLVTGDINQVGQLQRRLHNSVLTPVMIDVLSPSLMAYAGLEKGYGLFVRFEAIQESIAAQQAVLTDMAHALGLSVVPQADSLNSDLANSLHAAPVLCKVGMLPSAGLEFLAKVDDISDGQAIAMVHSKSGLGMVSFPHGKFLRQFRELRTFCQKHQGFLTMLQSPYNLKQQFDVWGYSGNALPLMKRIKTQFDPNNILSPHRFVGGI